ncbi:MAG: glycosyltransferase family 4 protein [Chitinophagaceae bacterium]|nr:glycosyltransferase family 4 protein [Chitinophagaceae bacterium]
MDDIYFDANPEPLAPDNIFKLVAVGNIRPAKNYEYLLDIFRCLKGHPVSVDIYGFGDHSRFSNISEKENLAVRFMGPAINPKEIYWKYNAFIMPSKHESFGLTAYEAMASGLPLFLSDLHTFKSLIKTICPKNSKAGIVYKKPA